METFTTYGVGPDQPTYAQLREQNRVLREALQEIYEGRWTPGVSCCYEDDARSIYPTREMRIRSIAQAALTATSQPAQEQCSYCKRPLTDNHSFSYGVPGVPRVYKCDRADCTKPATSQEGQG